MPEELELDPNQATTQEAQLAAERMNEGKEKPAAVDIEGDYEASKQFSVSDIDKTGAGATAAEAATKPQLEVPEAKDMANTSTSTGNPDDYRQMARETNPRANE